MTDERIEVPLIRWIGIGVVWAFLALGGFLDPLGRPEVARLLRIGFWLMLAVHAGEGFYAVSLARKRGLSAAGWYLRTLYLGFLAWTVLK